MKRICMKKIYYSPSPDESPVSCLSGLQKQVSIAMIDLWEQGWAVSEVFEMKVYRGVLYQDISFIEKPKSHKNKNELVS